MFANVGSGHLGSGKDENKKEKKTIINLKRNE